MPAINGPSLFASLLEAARGLPPEWRRWSHAEALVWLRRRLGFKQTELARRSRVAQSQISKIEGGGDARLSTWIKLFGAMGLDLLLVPLGDADAALAEARRRRTGRDHRQVPRQRPRRAN